MPDDHSGERVKDQSTQQYQPGKLPNSPTPPNNPTSPPAAGIGDKDMENAVQALGDRVKRAEWMMIGLTAAIALFALGSVIVGVLQWSAMEGQLGEMKSSGIDMVEADRPWIGVAMRIDEPELGKIPRVDVSMINSGKRPARITRMQYQGKVFATFPKDPPYASQGPPSTGILMPNQPSLNTYNVTGEAVNQETMNTLSGESPTLYLYINIEYTDVRTGKSHYTHACWQHVPKTKGLARGFYGCPEYQDAN